MAITIQGDNRGIAVDGNLTIEKLDFVFGQGVSSASGVHQDIPEAVVVETEEIPVVSIKNQEYPEITDANRNFFEEVFVVTGDVNGKVSRKVLDLPVDELLHRIYNLTADWNPELETSVHKWRLLYELLKRMKYFTILEKEKYGKFVNAVVKYCFPNVKTTYNNNISKSILDEHFVEWTQTDKDLYKTLKNALTFG